MSDKYPKMVLEKENGQQLLQHHHPDGALAKLSEEEKKKALEAPMTPYLLFAVTVCAIGSSFQFGYNTGVVNTPQEVVQDWIYISHNITFNSDITAGDNTLIWSITVSIFAIGGMIGGILSGPLADKFGRKGAMFLNNIFAFIAAGLMGFSKILEMYILLIVGRFIIGFNSGINTGLAPMYLTEVSPVNLRGALGSVHQLMATIAILISQVLGMDGLLGNNSFWALLFALTAIPAVIQVFLLPFCPETPKYSLIEMNQTRKAEKNLRKLRGKQDVDIEMEEMQEEHDRTKTTLFEPFTLFT